MFEMSDLLIVLFLICIIFGFFPPRIRHFTTEEVLEKLDYEQWKAWDDVCDELSCTSPFQKDRVLRLLAAAAETGLVDTRNEPLAVWEQRIPRKEYRRRKHRKVIR